MKKFLVVFMNRLLHFKTQSIDWYAWWVDEEYNESIYGLFYSLFSRETRILSSCFLFITARFSLDTSGETSSRITLICSFVEISLFVDGRYIATYFIMITHQQNVGIPFLMTHVLQLQFLYCFTWNRNQILFWTSSLFFFSRHFCLSTQFISFLTVESAAIYQLTFFRIFSCFLYFFGYCKSWLLLINRSLCHTHSK